MKKSLTILPALLLLLGSFGARASSVIEEDITIVNPLDSTVLHGTLSIPDKETPRAVVVLATGSGLQDRDETVGKHKPFKEIAEYLSSNGYAVIRTDDRGFGNPPDTALIERSTQWDELSDYRSVIDMARKDVRFAGKQVGLLGHSLGGSEAIMAFSKSDKAKPYNAVGSDPDFIVTLAAPVVPGDSLVLDQVRQMLRLQGAEYMFGTYADMLSKRYGWAKSFMPEKTLRNLLMEDILSTLPPGTPVDGEARKLIDAQVDAFVSPGYRELLRYDPAADIAEISVPWLALYGTKDTQVGSGLNASRLKELTSSSPNVSVRVLVDKNHLFQNALTGSVQEYDQINGSISDDVLQEILEWLLQLERE